MSDVPFRDPMSVDAPESGFRSAASAIGVLVMLTGFGCAMFLFYRVWEAATHPERLQPLLQAWAVALGGDGLSVKIEGQSYPVAKLVAALCLGGATVVMATLATSIMAAGGKIVSWTLGEKEAVKRILLHALGTRNATPIAPPPSRP